MRHPLFATGALGYLLVVGVGIGGFEAGLRGTTAAAVPLVIGVAVAVVIRVKFGPGNALPAVDSQ